MARFSGRFTVEVWNEGNSPHVFGPTKTKCYARWDFANTAQHSMSSAGHKALAVAFRDGIPGMCLQLDADEFIGRIFWPQSMKGDGEIVAKKLAAIYKQHAVTLGQPRTFSKPEEYKLWPDDFKYWCLELSRMIDKKMVKFCTGSDTEFLSTSDILKLPGKLKNDPWSDTKKVGTGKVGDERPVPYLHVVSVPKDYGVDHNAVVEEMAAAQT